MNRNIVLIKKDIDRYFDWYGVNGIFLDEVSTDCSLSDDYASLMDYIRAKEYLSHSVGGSVPQPLTVLNHGTQTNECYANSGDILVTFEGVYSSYSSWSPQAWHLNYSPSKFMHLVYDTSSGNLSSAVNMSKNNGAGWIYMTPDVLTNPWDTLPSEPYWGNLLTAANTSSTRIIHDWTVQNDTTNMTYSYHFEGTQTWKRVYVDTDHSTSTGFLTGGIGADRLIENGWIYTYAGSGSDWNWTNGTWIGVSVVSNLVSWTASFSALGISNPSQTVYIELVFQVQESGIMNTPVIRHYL